MKKPSRAVRCRAKKRSRTKGVRRASQARQRAAQQLYSHALRGFSFHEVAEAELAEAARYYEARSRGLGKQFLA